MFYSGKINSLLAIAVAVLCSCSQVDEIDIADTAQEKVEDAKVVFRLKSNTTSVTRSTSTVEDSYEDPIPAYPAEYRVNTARVYFFNSATKLFAKSVNLTNIKESKTINNNVDMTYETDTISIAQGTYDIFVTANTHRQLNTETEDAFLADIDNDIYKGALIQDVSGGIVMSNRAVDNLHTDEQLKAYRTRLIDRFGPVPHEGEELMMVVPLRRMAGKLGCEKLMLKQGRMTLFFVSNPNSPFYQSSAFDSILQFVATNPRRCQFRDTNGKRSLFFSNIPTVESALQLLKSIIAPVK